MDPVDDLTKDLAAGGKFAQAELTVTDAEKMFLSGMFNKDLDDSDDSGVDSD